MTTDQIILFAILALLFAFLIWGRWRYDLVAFAALMVALLANVVPTEAAFSGFGHPATIVVALVLIISRGLSNSGVVELIASKAVDATRSLFVHIGIMSGVAAALSAVMNNVAALALLMPVDLKAAAAAKRSPALTLNAVVVCLDSRRARHPDRHPAQHHHCDGPRQGVGHALPHV